MQRVGMCRFSTTDSTTITILTTTMSSSSRMQRLAMADISFFDLLADYATCEDHSGTFTAAEDFGINTFVSGYLDDGYLAGSWYAELEDGAASGVMAPLTEGTVTVTLNSDGTQTYVFDFKDDRGNKITGSVTANPYSSGYALSAQPKTKSYAIELPKRVVR